MSVEILIDLGEAVLSGRAARSPLSVSEPPGLHRFVPARHANRTKAAPLPPE
jgi:hypothetical protein